MTPRSRVDYRIYDLIEFSILKALRRIIHVYTNTTDVHSLKWVHMEIVQHCIVLLNTWSVMIVRFSFAGRWVVAKIAKVSSLLVSTQGDASGKLSLSTSYSHDRCYTFPSVKFCCWKKYCNYAHNYLSDHVGVHKGTKSFWMNNISVRLILIR